jgi:DNA-directed RNA polymerase specialized sigma24 family protein
MNKIINTELENQIETLWNQYNPILLGYFINKIGHREEANDLVAKTFAKYFMSQTDRNDLPANPKAYLWKIADNLLKDFYKHKSTTKFELTEKTFSLTENEGMTENQNSAISEIISCIKKNLTNQEFELLNQVYLDKQKYQDIDPNKNPATLRKQNSRSKMNVIEKCKALVKKLLNWF